MNWLYYHAIPSLTQADVDKDDDPYIIEYQNLAAAFVLGEALIDNTFKDTVMNALLAKARRDDDRKIFTAGPRMVKTIYEGTPTCSPARKFMVEIYHGHSRSIDMVTAAPELPHEFLVALSAGLLRVRKLQALNNLQGSGSSCAYHSHGPDQACSTDRKRA